MIKIILKDALENETITLGEKRINAIKNQLINKFEGEMDSMLMSFKWYDIYKKKRETKTELT
ncbi:MAG: hypothetical protein ACRCU3_10945 [Eubacteriaceae bacterium]